MTKAKRGAQISGALSEGGVFEARPWGGFCILEEGPGYKVKRLGAAKGGSAPRSTMPPGEVAPPPPALGAEQPAAEPLAARRGFPGRSTRRRSRNRVSETRRSRTAR